MALEATGIWQVRPRPEQSAGARRLLERQPDGARVQLAPHSSSLVSPFIVLAAWVLLHQLPAPRVSAIPPVSMLEMLPSISLAGTPHSNYCD